MSGAEWFEMYQGSLSNALTAFAAFTTLVSAYMFVAYAVGQKLTTLQVSVARFYSCGRFDTPRLNDPSWHNAAVARMS